MRINRNNYEIWFIDFADGKLSAEDRKELFQFLNSHPDLQEEFENFENIKLENDETVFQDKDNLKRSSLVLSLKNQEEYFISYYENLLSPADKKAVEQYVNNYPGVKKDFETFRKSYLTTGKIVFDEKEILKTSHPEITVSNQDWWIISTVENSLTEKEGVVFDNEIKNNVDFKVEFEKYQHTILVSSSVIFTDKDSLKRNDRKIIPIYLRYVSYAAAACLILFFGWKWNSGNNTVNPTSDGLRAVNLDLNLSPEMEKDNNDVFIAEEKTDHIIKEDKIRNSPKNVLENNKESVKDKNSVANYIPLEKIRMKYNPGISVSLPENDIVRINTQTVDSSKMNMANSENEKSPTVTALAFGDTREKYLTPKEFMLQQFNKKILNKNTTDNPSSEELASVASVKISDATQTPVNITAAGKEDEYKTYGFSIGKFGFSRTKKK